MRKLSEEEITLFLNKNKDWKLVDDKWLERKYRFKEYLRGVEFVQNIANLSEERNHHPFISIDYKLVRIKLSSWKANGLTDMDMDLAEEYDLIYQQDKG